MKLACWVISLNPEAENTVKLLMSLQRQGLSAEIFPAVDGRDAMPPLERDERLNKTLSLIRHRKLLTNSEMGCYLSHLRAVRKAYDEGYSHVCLFEDDVVIEDDFAEVLFEFAKDDVELVRYMALRLRRRKTLREFVASSGVAYKLVRPERGAVGAQAYLMNRRGMKKFIDCALEIYEPVDKLFDHFWLFDLQVCGVEPHTVYELEHETSVQKVPDTTAVKPNWWQRLLFHPVKLWFSIRRHSYMFMHRRDFLPASMPEGVQGKTRRIR